MCEATGLHQVMEYLVRRAMLNRLVRLFIPIDNPHDSWRYVTKWRSRVTRLARGGARVRTYLKQYVEGLSGGPPPAHRGILCRLLALANPPLQ